MRGCASGPTASRGHTHLPNWPAPESTSNHLSGNGRLLPGQTKFRRRLRGANTPDCRRQFLTVCGPSLSQRRTLRVSAKVVDVNDCAIGIDCQCFIVDINEFDDNSRLTAQPHGRRQLINLIVNTEAEIIIAS